MKFIKIFAFIALIFAIKTISKMHIKNIRLNDMTTPVADTPVQVHGKECNELKNEEECKAKSPTCVFLDNMINPKNPKSKPKKRCVISKDACKNQNSENCGYPCEWDSKKTKCDGVH